MIKTITPIDNSLLVERKFANENEIDVALQNTLNARRAWREESLDTRIKYLKNFVKFFLSNQNEITKSLYNEIFCRNIIFNTHITLKNLKNKTKYPKENS